MIIDNIPRRRGETPPTKPIYNSVSPSSSSSSPSFLLPACYFYHVCQPDRPTLALPLFSHVNGSARQPDNIDSTWSGPNEICTPTCSYTSVTSSPLRLHTLPSPPLHRPPPPPRRQHNSNQLTNTENSTHRVGVPSRGSCPGVLQMVLNGPFVLDSRVSFEGQISTFPRNFPGKYGPGR